MLYYYTKMAEGNNWRKSWQMLAGNKSSQVKAFTEQLDDAALEFFNSIASRPISQQAVAFLNAYWPEVSSEAEFIFNVAFEHFKNADMHSKGIQLVYQYEEGVDIEFDIGLYFYEQLCKFVEENPKAWGKDSQYAKSQPVMMTSLKRKQELRDNVDVNFDGRVSFLEYLLYQYKDCANPADFVQRSMGADEHPEITKARNALDAVNARIREYEAEKARLEEASKLEGVKGLQAKNLLAQLDSSPLKEELQKALITAEAAVRMASKKYGGANAKVAQEGAGGASSQGAIWWMEYDLKQKKAKYGKGK